MIHKQINNEQKDYCIMSQKLATILISKGFKLHKVSPNKKYPNMSVFYFYYNDELVNEVEKHMRENNAEKQKRIQSVNRV